ncbi:type III polyketide synthase [Cryptosporangium phraense]|uniref:Type III polyketide synthase n=1 Tax=Cryptosporangium phraense TaxID=2593070 RepID=A0A545AE27_9ACTN|nr:3-oxoacyl-[acyl-carrier-protein] synthase III C-terminal domain-containing protein [Cryptosporangium phraense]TQS39596.1 type III polyketide synthase [Cryptosporangium phraense]
MTQLAAVHGVLPDHRYPQAELTDLFAEVGRLDDTQRRFLERVHGAAGVQTRHLVLPIDEYRTLKTFDAANDAFLTGAVDLGCRAITGALADAGLEPGDVDAIIAVTSTGLAIPSLDAHIAGRLGLREDVKRTPVVGLGCAAGAVGLSRLHDYVRAWPDQVAVLVVIELCSLTVQYDDRSATNLVASGLFGDGAAAVVAVGGSGPGPEVTATRSALYAGTLRTMGFDVGASGLKVVLGTEVPSLAEQHLRRNVDQFLGDHGLTRRDITTWVSHPGGPKVLEAIESGLELPEGALGASWSSLRRVGNISSASVLHILEDTLRDRTPERGTPGLLLAMGPGFSAELVLLQW